MSNTRIVQRSPDIGISIRLQRLQPVQEVQKAEQLPTPTPKAPVWWGWFDVDGNRESTLSTRWSAIDPNYPYGYWPGLWAALVEDAAFVQWSVEFTPTIWFQPDDSNDTKIVVAWSGDPVTLELPPPLPETSAHLFTPAAVPLPNPLKIEGFEIAPDSYWPGGDQTPGFPSVPMPSLIAAGNTLSVGQETKAMSGTLVAEASVGGQKVGKATLNLMRVIHRTWS